MKQSKPPGKKAKAAEIPKVETTKGKSSNPDFERLTVYLRKTTKKAAWRRWEDQGGKDVSELVEHLLTLYLAGGVR